VRRVGGPIPGTPPDWPTVLNLTPDEETGLGEVSRWMDWRRRGTAGRTDLLPSTYQKAPCKSEVELLMAIIVDIVSNVAPRLRSVVRSRQNIAVN